MALDSYLVFDFETSGLSPTADRIVQVGVCAVAQGKIACNDCWIVNQDITIPREATRIHGITTERMKAEGIAPKESLARLFEMMNQAATCVGHNIHRFDIPFMLADARRLGLTPPPTDNFVDTAALYKGWKLGVARRPGETHRRYAENVLSRMAYGVRLSIPVCLDELGSTWTTPTCTTQGATPTLPT